MRSSASVSGEHEGAMMELRHIPYPDHLNEHTLSQQELALLSDPGKQALAKDWNVINHKINWLIRKSVDHHNLLVDWHKTLETWRRIVWLLGIVGGGITLTVGILKIIQMTKGLT